MERTGTFWCLLWGHKFTQWITREITDFDGNPLPKGAEVTKLFKTDFCVRCGYTPKE